MIEKTAYNYINSSLNSPAFVFDIDVLKEHLNMVKNSISPFKLCYAMKANPLLVSVVEPFVERIEVCSEGEFEICKAYKIPSKKIFYTGVLKSLDGIKSALEYGVRLFNIESQSQLEMIKNLDKNVGLFLRLSSDNHFGIDEALISEILKDDSLNILGLHYFAGTFRDKKRHFDIARLGEFLSKYKFKELEYGAGLGVVYFDGEKDIVNLETLKNDLESFKIPVCVELGRYLVAKCGFYASKVGDIKTSQNVNYAILDGGMNHLNYYGQMMGMKNPIILNSSDKNLVKAYTLCGPICSTNDVITRSAELNELKIGDILCFLNTGAYSSTEASYLFLSRDLPSIYLYENVEFKLMREPKNTYNLNMKG
ncbi:diaminopimelate decarboxylase [Campylobacter hyointestinalis subsp. hyointestinalis]|uniref:Diaminopimelate decarboxylase n=1 Tax=Campylobacter hyointestinalis subsp. hyointestinalis TaxID=91352 RepID=A0A9W5APN9_CAMHY|nr:hypothetical protein [Campylobacter hyointestinalis]CUU72870.1 diaminopimelate decarboxylase [Campylobacter hyointestinalis subsp. hyointestinalis]CUU80914.1 diaminopimelate decarboxylase [Campylobacter hyointestinalis subsp. hyointestinalis]CUU90115.1 diaminopimelate decarboxylase [Campylobacter hyointestinalis subsp. hyointestinalis]